MSKKFISEVIKSRGTIGALSPSSSFLANKMLQPIDFSQSRCIVEYGPGTGVFTEKILQKLNSDSLLLAFEINNEFADDLKKINDKRLIIINDSAEKIQQHLDLHNQKTADYIISSLPLAVLENDVVSTILYNSSKLLSEKGKFIQFQYSLSAKEQLETFFPNVEIGFTLLNFPPAFIYVCSK
ncbi:ribosomal RNA adenine dimethylase [Flavobacterium sp. SM15]|uniref:class I SAM-dependent methyltransferase n=1 Tax=Flavobacterium sp. SM15 TaxID=2908005 RepID=UPI001EDAFDCA|nr:rRNA adenine N-6-methyltransferase family protein [Flavobacterium sp. SM15]MCG2610037.1 ribosomal RNA adenine dimethylase [Flavobacterium sp. SM15]